MVRMTLILLVFQFILLLAGCSGEQKGEMGRRIEVSKLEQATEKDVLHMNKALILAAAKGDTSQVLEWIASGADINFQDERGRTAIMAATYANKQDTVEVLIKAGADVNIRDDRKDNPLLYAGAEGLAEIVKLLIDAGADPALTNRYGGVAIIPAAERGHLEVIKELLNHSDIDIDHVNDLGWTALLEAIILSDGGEKHQQIVKLLVDQGADVNLADSDGVTPLEHAKRRGYQEIEDILIQAGAK